MNITESEKSIRQVFGKSIWTKFRRGIRDYRLISPGDKIAVCISGGKDSMLMAQCLKHLHRNGEIPFEPEFIVVDPGYSAENMAKIRKNCEILDISPKFFGTEIFSSAEASPKNPCFLCARLRRGFLYKTAQELGCGKIALGHHFDDVIETILMAMLYGSQMQTMLPRLAAENYPVEVIRPLYLVREADIIGWAEHNGLEFIRCACKMSENGGGSSKRAEVKELLRQMRAANPCVDMNIFRSAENVDLRRIISYHDGSERHHFLDKFHD
ncbi:MAG: tRNA 2-thiocytidine biosynthesis protein TtcA [Ruminococcus sp.]|nr:tRNA 2-thiocytidine biosynthesis protein TtcA [Ruminococcus sp.]